jgi:hypothetical protein
MWLDADDLRDQKMVANIAEYAARSEFTSGVFLVGAAHRKSIMDKVLSGLGTAPSQVEWQLELPPALFD